MNLIQMSEQLKDVPDQLLLKEVQAPSGAYPSYLVVTEMTRRKRMRDQAAQEAPQSTVVEDLTKPSREQMMLAMQGMQRPPAMPQGMPPGMPMEAPEMPTPQAPGIMAMPQATETLAAQDVMGARRMAAGGMVSFAEGGQPKYDDRGVMRFQDQGTVPRLDEYGRPYKTLAERAKVEPSVLERWISSFFPPPSVPISPSEYGITSSIPAEQLSDEALVNYGNQPAPTVALAPTPTPTPATTMRVPGAGMAMPQVPNQYGDIAAANLQAIRGYQQVSPQELSRVAGIRSAEYAQQVPFRMGFLEQEIAKRQQDMEGRRASNINEALMQAGLGIMGSKSRYFGQAVGEGGTAGLNAYRQGLKDIREGENQLMQSRVALANSQTLYDQNKFAEAGRARAEALELNKAGLERLNTENAALARSQQLEVQRYDAMIRAQAERNRAAQAGAELGIRQQMLPHEIELKKAQAAELRLRPEARALSDEDQKRASAAAERFAWGTGKPQNSPEFQQAYNTKYEEEIARARAGASYKAQASAPPLERGSAQSGARLPQ